MIVGGTQTIKSKGQIFLTVQWDGLQCVIVVFPDHTHFLTKQLTSVHTHTLVCMLDLGDIAISSLCNMLVCNVDFGPRRVMRHLYKMNRPFSG